MTLIESIRPFLAVTELFITSCSLSRSKGSPSRSRFCRFTRLILWRSSVHRDSHCRAGWGLSSHKRCSVRHAYFAIIVARKKRLLIAMSVYLFVMRSKMSKNTQVGLNELSLC